MRHRAGASTAQSKQHRAAKSNTPAPKRNSEILQAAARALRNSTVHLKKIIKIRVNISVVNIKTLTNDRLLFKQDAKNQN